VTALKAIGTNGHLRFATLLLSIVFLAPTPGFAANKTATEPRAASGVFDYGDYASVLSSFVDNRGGVDYKGLKAHPAKLKSFLKSIADLDPRQFAEWPEKEKIAFWINAYNSLTLKAIVDHYPIRSSWFKSFVYPANSIRQIKGVWDTLTFPVMGKRMTLEQIEHKKLRANFHEPRIHAALVCAAKSCPPLRNEPFVGSSLDSQLDDQMRAFLSNPTKFLVDRKDRVVYLSKIFNWFGEDFVSRYGTDTEFKRFDKTQRAVLNAVSRFTDSKTQTYLRKGTYNIKYLNYDWTLNEQ